MKSWYKGVIDGQEYLRERCSRFAALYEERSSSEEAIWHRFISFFKGDVLRNPSEQDYKHMRTGDGIVHHGKCYRDAHLNRARWADRYRWFSRAIWLFASGVTRVQVLSGFQIEVKFKSWTQLVIMGQIFKLNCDTSQFLLSRCLQRNQL